MDGVDAALVEVARFRGRISCQLLGARTFPFPRSLVRRLREAASGAELAPRALAELSAATADRFSLAAIRLMESHGPADLIASHGQTVAHHPGRRTVTVQIGEPAIIAERTGRTTVADFRLADTAAGGEGAPLVPVAHYHLFADPARTRAIVNVGGIANATLLPAGEDLGGTIASDTGPGNILIDECVALLTGGRRRCDRGGRMAASGKVDERLVEMVLGARFFRRRLPASTGREDFGEPLATELVRTGMRLGLDGPAIVASATAAAARSIARGCRRLAGDRAIDELYLCGGGAYNDTLREMLAAEMPGVRVASTADLGVEPAFLEAQAFALLGWLTVHGLPGNLPGVTGASGPRVLGKIVPGSNFAGARLRHPGKARRA